MSTEQVGGLTRDDLRDRLGIISFIENEGPADPSEQRAWDEVLAHDAALRAENERLREALERAATGLHDAGCQCGGPSLEVSEPSDHEQFCPLYVFGIARHALGLSHD